MAIFVPAVVRSRCLMVTFLVVSSVSGFVASVKFVNFVLSIVTVTVLLPGVAFALLIVAFFTASCKSAPPNLVSVSTSF